VPGARLEVAAVELRIRGLLLHHEDVDAQAEQRVQRLGFEVGEGLVVDGRHRLTTYRARFHVNLIILNNEIGPSAR